MLFDKCQKEVASLQQDLAKAQLQLKTLRQDSVAASKEKQILTKQVQNLQNELKHSDSHGTVSVPKKQSVLKTSSLHSNVRAFSLPKLNTVLEGPFAISPTLLSVLIQVSGPSFVAKSFVSPHPPTARVLS
jgi:hypothetical protein